jgi:hypothetical protein
MHSIGLRVFDHTNAKEIWQQWEVLEAQFPFYYSEIELLFPNCYTA